jgi:hypothetical protein
MRKCCWSLLLYFSKYYLTSLKSQSDARDYMAKKVFLLSAKMGLDDDSVRLQLTRSCSTPLLAQQLIDSVGIKNNDAK